MSLNQSRSEKSDSSSQFRTSGRSTSFNYSRNSSGGPTKGGGPTAHTPSLSSNRSLKKINNAQGGQSRASVPGLSSDSSRAYAARIVENGAHVQQPPLHGASYVPVTGLTAKSTDVSTQKTTRPAPKAPSSSAAAVMSDNKGPTTPAKVPGDDLAPGDASRSCPLQFGSISSVFTNGIQIPARTSSAPPNLDEQKCDQVRHDSLRAGPTLPLPSIPTQQLPRKDAGSVDQSNTGEPHPTPKVKRDVQVSARPPVAQAQKQSAHPIPGMPMQIPFHQPQAPIQFGGPNPQIQSQGMIGTSMAMPMPMPLPMGNPPQLHQPVFVRGLQPHTMQAAGIMHQGQRLNFSSQMGSQLPPQLGNMGIGVAQFSQQQAGKFGGPRKPIKITHPDTNEELRLDGSSGQRSHPNVPPQSQHIPSFTPAHSIKYHANTYNTSSRVFSAPSSLPLSNTQITPSSQAPRFYNQVTVKPAAASHGEKVADSSLSVSSPAVEKSEHPTLPNPHGGARYPQQDSETLSQSILQQSKSGIERMSTSMHVSSKQSVSVSDSISTEGTVSNSLSAPPDLNEDSVSLSASSTGGTRRETVTSDFVTDPPNKFHKEGHSLLQNQVGGPSSSLLSSHSESLENSSSLDSGVPKIVEVKTSASSGISGVNLETMRESWASIDVATPDASNSRSDHSQDGTTCESSEMFSAGTRVASLNDKRPNLETLGTNKQEIILPGGSKQDGNSFETCSDFVSTECLEVTCQIEQSSAQGAVNAGLQIGSSEMAERNLEAPVDRPSEDDRVANNLVMSNFMVQDGINAEPSPSSFGLSTASQGEKASNASLIRNDSACSEEVTGTKSGMLDQELALVSVPSLSEATLNCEGEDSEKIDAGLVSNSASGSKDKSLVEPNRAKITMAKKKNRKVMLQKADAAGTSSDLYMAYKGPEEKKENATSAESTESSSSLKQVHGDTSLEDVSSEKVDQIKAEPDDWEDAADISTPKLETSDNGKHNLGGLNQREGEIEVMTKKYSRDFLLKFAEQFIHFPEDFEITSDMADALIVSNVNVSHESYPSPGRVIDRQTGGSRLDRRGSGLGDYDKWSKLPGPLAAGRDMHLDIGYGGNEVGFRPGQGGNYGVLKNLRAQIPVQLPGGILSGPMQSLATQGTVQRNGPDSDRWQRAAAFQRGLIPSPQTPLQVMHKAEKKYEVGKVNDEEQAKQRQLKGILNKLTPQNFEKLFEQVKQVNIDNGITLTGVISQIFDKALTEPTFCEMYANFCYHLACELPDLSVDNQKITFKRLLLNKCQEEFERGEREQEEANKADEEGEAKLSEVEREEKRIRARRRMLGNIRLIGELYKKKMLTERIMHECLKKLLGQPQNPDEEDVEALCKLMSTIGEMIDHPKAKEHMDAYFDMMANLSNNMKLSSRLRFMLKDAIDLRKNKWQQRRKVEGPKKIEDVHRDAAQERHAQASRLARPPSLGSSARRGQPLDFVPRGSTMFSPPSAQMGVFRGVSPQLRGYGAQDARFEDRNSFESRTLSVTLPHRLTGDDSITLGPQGGLARGMSIRGQPSVSSISLTDMPSTGDSRRMTVGMNGYSAASERAAYGSRVDPIQRSIPERFANPSTYDTEDRNMNQGNRDVRNADRSFDRSLTSSLPTRGREPISVQNVSSEKALSEECLRDMSMAAIKEFYSAKDEKEVALCMKDLNAPSFYPSMISIWVTDSFERKDMERDLLAKLLINLTKSQVMISQHQLIKGFESVLTTLEDAVNDAPRAAEFLGYIFAQVILENVVPFAEIEQLINEGGEEHGRLVEIGLAAKLLGRISEKIHSEKEILPGMRSVEASNLRRERASDLQIQTNCGV